MKNNRNEKYTPTEIKIAPRRVCCCFADFDRWQETIVNKNKCNRTHTHTHKDKWEVNIAQVEQPRKQNGRMRVRERGSSTSTALLLLLTHVWLSAWISQWQKNHSFTVCKETNESKTRKHGKYTSEVEKTTRWCSLFFQNKSSEAIDVGEDVYCSLEGGWHPGTNTEHNEHDYASPWKKKQDDMNSEIRLPIGSLTVIGPIVPAGAAVI